MGLFGSRPTPVYSGQTFRREVVRNIHDYGGAWRNGDSRYSAGKDYRASSGGVVGKGRYARNTYQSARLASNSVYGVDDGTYLQNVELIPDNSRRYGREQTLQAKHSEARVGKNENNAIYRYIEDSKGQFGVAEYNGRSPSKFINVSRIDIASTSGKTKAAISKPQGEPKKETISQTAKKRKGSIGTSRFKIDLGGTTRTSGLGIPTA